MSYSTPAPAPIPAQGAAGLPRWVLVPVGGLVTHFVLKVEPAPTKPPAPALAVVATPPPLPSVSVSGSGNVGVGVMSGGTINNNSSGKP